MKKILSILLVMACILSCPAFAEADDMDKIAATYESEGEEGITVVTVYNLGLISNDNLPDYIVEKSDESEAEEPAINDRVSHRAKNAVVIQIGNYAAVANDLLEWIDKDNKSVIPYIKENRTMVPLRYIAEKLGAEVGYNDATREVSITLGKDVFKVVIGEKSYTLNDKKFELDAPAEIVENRTFVPIRVISEAFKKNVKWIESGRYVIITPAQYPWDENNSIEKETLSRMSLMISPLVRDLAYGVEK